MRGGSKVLDQMEDEYIGNIFHKYRDPRGRAAQRISGLKCPKNLSTKPANTCMPHVAPQTRAQRGVCNFRKYEIILHKPLYVPVYASHTVVKRDYENCCTKGLLFIIKVLKCGEVRMLMTPFRESRALSKFKYESTGRRS